MSREAEMERVLQALKKYFEQAQLDDEYNKDLIRDDIRLYGEALIPIGLAYIVKSLKNEYRKTFYRFSHNEEAGDHYLTYFGIDLMDKFHSVLLSYGEMGIEKLIKILNYQDEDIAALSAFMLSSGDFIQDSSINKLYDAYGNSFGTAYKITLAYALFVHGKIVEFEKFALPFFFENVQIISFIDRKSAVSRTAKPDYIWGMLALDIVSDGKAYKGPLRDRWVKKQ